MERWQQPIYKIPIDGKWAKIEDKWLEGISERNKPLYRQLDYFISEFQKNPISFFLPHGPDHPIHGNMGKAILNDHEHDLILTTAPNQVGKMQSYDTPVITPTGERLLGDLKVGDYVIGGDGKPCRILHITDHPNMQLYKITFDNDEVSTEAGLEHQWKYLRHSRAYKHKVDAKHKNSTYEKWETVSTEDIIKMQGVDGNPQKAGYIPACKPVEFIGFSKFVIPPYSMGALLGDGTLGGDGVRFTSEDNDALARVKSEVEGIATVRKLSKYDYNISGFVDDEGKRHQNVVRDEIARLGVNCNSLHKFIPREYKYAPIGVRKDILRGLMDADGTIGAGGRTEFYSISKQLAEDVAWIVRSLGGKAKIKVKPSHYIAEGERVQCHDCYRVFVRMSINPFYMERKASRWRPSTRRKDRVVRCISPSRVADCRCIAVDSPDKTYLCNDFIVTHNTTVAAAYSILRIIPCNPDWPIFQNHGIICPEWQGPKILIAGTYSWDLMNGLWNAYRELLPRSELTVHSPNWGRFQGETGRPRNIRFHNIGKEVILSCGSKIIFKCYRQSVSQWESIQCDLAHMDEQCDEDRFDAVSQRQSTRGDYTPIIMALTGHVIPDRPDTGAAGWIKQKIVDRNETKGRKVAKYKLDIATTPEIFMSKKRKEKLYIQWVKEPKENRDFKKEQEGIARYWGGWQHGAGLVFDMFSEEIHCIKQFDLKHYKPTIYRMIDHGTKPLAAGLFAVMPWGDIVMYDEVYEDVTAISAGAARIVRMCGNSTEQASENYWNEVQSGTKLASSECDCRSFGTKSPESGKTIGQIYNENGCWCFPAPSQPDTQLIPLAQELLALRKGRTHIDVTLKRREPNELDKMGCPMLYITENCYNMMGELRKYAGDDKDDHLISVLKFFAGRNRPYNGDGYMAGAGNGFEYNNDPLYASSNYTGY